MGPQWNVAAKAESRLHRVILGHLGYVSGRRSINFPISSYRCVSASHWPGNLLAHQPLSGRTSEQCKWMQLEEKIHERVHECLAGYPVFVQIVHMNRKDATMRVQEGALPMFRSAKGSQPW